MTIDELIQRLRFDRELDMDINDLAEPIADLLEELYWWREQDLIKRKEAIDGIDYYMNEARELDKFNCYVGLDMGRGVVKSIPKAEPPKE